MRRIPATMVSQHPDHVSTPYWHSDAFIKTSEETYECFLSFSELGASEYKWDWEGKLVDESVIERLFHNHSEYFKHHPLGEEKFLTFRLPNPRVETEFRFGRALMVIKSASALASRIGYHNPPLFEVILPMTESAAEIISVQEAFHELGNLKHQWYRLGQSIDAIEVIPLFEHVDVIVESDRILERYLALHKKMFGFTPTYLRPYLARSDPALNAGLAPTVLAIKIALSRFRKFEEKHEIPLYPILGSACLPFRGGLTPESVDDFVNEYQGVRTALLQSAFRYDYPKPKVIEAIRQLEDILPQRVATTLSQAEEIQITDTIDLFEKPYRKTVEQIASLINEVARFIPKRRERVQHVGLFGYSRGIGEVKLPRAIEFTAALYSLGIPPELIGTGRGLIAARKEKLIPAVEQTYKNIKTDLLRAGAFFNRDNLEDLAISHSCWKDVKEDVLAIEEYLGRELGPTSENERKHATLTKQILRFIKNRKDPTQFVEAAAICRRSLG